MNSYNEHKVYKEVFRPAKEIHFMSQQLLGTEQFESGSQFAADN